MDDRDDGVTLGTWEDVAAAHEHALVVLAMGLPCVVIEAPEQSGFSVAVEPKHAQAVLMEWQLYDEEARARPHPRPAMETRTHPLRLDVAGGWVLSLLVVFFLQGRDPALSARFCNSTTDMMVHGEWWRPFTSLFLHRDMDHLLGNALLGGVFCVLVAQATGAVRGWTLILASGTIANALNAALRMPDEFRSLGASTATFAALGILVGYATRQAWRIRSFRGFRMLFAPIIAGGIMLSWFGGGTPTGNTDVLGHLLGCWVGFLAGVFLSPHRPIPVTVRDAPPDPIA
ncbi:MAG: rhomboid family intramembrane serine protease [Verrucomicrobia bacterium]|nr:rhomboid family intramembrane serine protease [Verrucomicrobiota bacterium]MCH8527627.1 rhomboid family intramembrane serine protease [Kiritimatiellia bacterium]